VIGGVVARRRRASRGPAPARGALAPTALPSSSGPPWQSARATVFISHNFDTEHPLALRLAADLRPRVDVWVAPESIQAGESWLTSVERGLSASGVFLALLSKAALSSPWVLKEIQAAMELEVERQMRLVPVQVEDCDLPILLRTYQVLRLAAGYGDVVEQTLRLAVTHHPG
jgi:hypothetical protein